MPSSGIGPPNHGSSSGGLYTAWGQFITPAIMGLPSAAMPIIWVAFSGRADLTATLVGTFVLLLTFQALTVYSQQYALILMGLLLLVTVLFVPAGFVAGLGQWLGRERVPPQGLGPSHPERKPS